LNHLDPGSVEVDVTQYDLIYDIVNTNYIEDVKLCSKTLEELRRTKEMYSGDGLPLIYVTDNNNVILFENSDSDTLCVACKSLDSEMYRYILDVMSNGGADSISLDMDHIIR
jgi:hypothetical protein